MSEVNVLKASIEPLVRMLAEKDVKVSFSRETTQPKTEFHKRGGITIKLPMISSKTSEQELSVLQGVVDHEVGHAIFSTDLPTLTIPNELDRFLLNVVEDARMEREMMTAFKGCRHNFRIVHRFLFDKKWVKEVYDSAKEDTRSLIIDTLIPGLRAMNGMEDCQEVVNAHAEMKAICKIVAENFGDDPISKLTSLQDAYEFSQKLKKLFHLDDAGAAPETSATGEGEKGESSEGGEMVPIASDGDSKEDSKDAPKESTESKSKDKEDDKGEESKSDESDGDKSEEKDEKKDSEGEGESASGEDKKDTAKAKSKPKTTKERTKEIEEIAEGEFSPSASLSEETLEKSLKRLEHKISKLVEEMMESDNYVVPTTDFDRIDYARASSSHTLSTSIIDEGIDGVTNAVQKKLERAIAARSMAVWTPGHRSGKLHAASLSRVLLNDSRVFRRKEEGESKDVSVSLLIDCSGSMSGAKIKLAAQAGYVFLQVLTRMGIKCEAIGFTTLRGDLSGGDWGDYSRVEPLYIPIFKSFNDKLDYNVKQRLVSVASDENGVLRNNVDGESVQIAANRLLSQPTKGKILIVLSDGEPEAHGNWSAQASHLRATVNEVSRKVKVIGIGVLSSAVKRYYPKSVVINDIGKLPTTVVKELYGLFLNP
ncbi:MAG: hypothetical protein Q4E62_03160 [Sutterellaceae bacterium]|nr:hypothetical protein [Sutterellaceae bacterium]